MLDRIEARAKLDPVMKQMLEAGNPAAFTADLHGYAAHDAAKTLADNWSDTLRDGGNLDIVVQDIDEVKSRLDAWRDAVLQRRWHIEREATLLRKPTQNGSRER